MEGWVVFHPDQAGQHGHSKKVNQDNELVFFQKRTNINAKR
jgi:hypothetical protein